MVAHGTVCLKRLGTTRGGELQAGRFFANPRVTVARIVEAWSEFIPQAARERHVLALQDTTAMTFATGAEARSAPPRRADTPSLTRRRRLGPLNDGSAHGLLAHVMIGVDADSGACLGLVGGDVWNRPGYVTSPEWARPFSERESRRWVETAEQARTVLKDAATVTVVHDREGDMYPLWARVPMPGWHVLSRANQDRKLSDGRMLFATADAFPLADTCLLRVPASPPMRAEREARVTLRFGTVEIRRSPNEKDRDLAKAVRLTLIDVRELAAPPDGVEPIHWRLLTTHEVTDAAAAWRVVGWYRRRWTIEQLFRILKTEGLRLEDSQLATAERLAKLTAAALKAACAILQLVQERNGAHGQPAGHVFGNAETDTIDALSPTLEGKTARQKNPHPARTLAHASWVVARLGGWNCYGKPPGPITMHRGLERLHAIHQGRMLDAIPKRNVSIP